MADLSDLRASLAMFTQGMQSLAISTGINDATEAVGKITEDQNMGIMEKRAQQQAVAKQLSLRMMASGASAGHIEQATAAIGPAPIKNSTDAYQQALASGDKDMMKIAVDSKKFEDSGDMAKLEAQGKNAIDVAKIHSNATIGAANIKEKGASERFDRADLESKNKQARGDLAKIAKVSLNPEARSAVGKYTSVISQADELRALLKQFIPPGKDLEKMTPEERVHAFDGLSHTMRTKLNTGIDRMISQSAPTVSGREHLMDPTLISKFQMLKSNLGNRVEGDKAGVFVEQMYDTVKRTRDTFVGKRDEILGDMPSAYPMAFERYPEEAYRLISHGIAKEPGAKNTDQSAADAATSAPVPTVNQVDARAQFIIQTALKHPDDPKAQAKYFELTGKPMPNAIMSNPSGVLQFNENLKGNGK